MLKYVLLLFIPSFAYSAGWYCQEVASEWVDHNVLSSCGIGQGKTEAEARHDAFEKAKGEVNAICNPNTNCGQKVINIDPKRTECTKDKKRYTCHRLFHYYITDVARKMEEKPLPQKRANIYQTNNIYNQNQFIDLDVDMNAALYTEMVIENMRLNAEIDREVERLMDEVQ
jgi:hypothetical protein